MKAFYVVLKAASNINAPICLHCDVWMERKAE